jgi:hypothetical protein
MPTLIGTILTELTAPTGTCATRQMDEPVSDSA